MNHALLFAGGVGARMKSADIPKQFIEVDGKPIIIRTLEKFSSHPEIDDIVISCLAEKIDYLWGLIRKFNLVQKVKSIVPGGSNGHGSIHNGLVEIQKFSTESDIVLICDGVRPLISKELISNCIKTAKEHSTAVPVTPSIDSVLESPDGQTCRKSLPRKEMFITQAPQGYTMQKIMWAHDEAEKRGIDNPVSSSELLIELGESVHIFIGDRDNIKVTTPEDLEYLRSRYYYRHFKHFAGEVLKYD
ncbi:MAG: 2-C-methyl-D-erythritol 4-phosphate cytidylyltransferase [Oscillospiraceae bacterium]|jgi:2-C-methyl-D-erythritol 4-phosphate cytidylyltransferase|nr:2-C-methyl-D-erythritol 4-phosphate cytidylyltransferase [Oscillospiraceae bacterium]